MKTITTTRAKKFGSLKSYLIALTPAASFAVVALAVFFTTLVIKNRTFYVFPDNIDQFFAWYQKLATSLHHGSLPLWDANTNGGHSFVGELQQGVFYPVNLLWVWIFGSVHGISIFFLELIVVAHFWFASLGMYYAARSLGLSKYAAFASGLAYAYGSTVAVRSVSQTAIFFGLCYIPWAFFAFNTWLAKRRKRDLFFTGLALGFIILAGHIQPWYHACLLILFLILLQSPSPHFRAPLKRLRSHLIALVTVVVISGLVALPQVLLSAQYLPQAYRFVGDPKPIGPSQKVSIETFTKTYSYTPENFLSVVDPVKHPVVDGNEIYIGLIGLTVILFTLTLGRRKLKEHVVWQRYSLFLVGTTAVSAVIMIGYLTFIPAIMRLIPLVSQIRQLARYSVLVHFCLCVMVGIGVEVIAEYVSDLPAARKKKYILFIAFSAAAGFMLLNAIYLFKVAGRGAVSKHYVYQNAIVGLALAGCIVLRSKVKLVLVGAFMLSAIVQPTWFLPRINDHPATYAPTYYRRTPSITFLEKYYGKSRVLIQNNALPVNIGDVYKIQTVNGYGATLQKPFFDYLNEPENDLNSGIHMDLLNVQFLVDNKEHPELTLRLYDRAQKAYVYERPQFMPRIYYADEANACHAHLEGCTAITTSAYGDSDIKFATNATAAKQVVVSEVYYEGWKATVDGQPVPLGTYGGTDIKLFRAVSVPAGRHTVELTYKPFSL